jgi:hypothetical protein
MKITINNKTFLSVRELLLDFADYSERDKTSQTTDECVDNYLDDL